ncbi:MAG TPA: ATP-binding protein [Steroidobacteraceae bacterium]|nr:ATP-binding protein [Steroidobacteraceae bacterium]
MNQAIALPEALLHYSPDALIVVDSQGIIRFTNDTCRMLFGYPAGQLIGKPVDILLPERFRARHGAHTAAYWRQPTNREMAARSADLFARRADGSEFAAGIRLAPFQVDGVHYIATAVRDMTEQRAIADALLATRTEAERANRAKSRFLAAASHDLRQPMQAIRLLNASMLKAAPLAAHLRELLQRQEQAIDSATHMLDALLDISRLESGAVSAQLGAVNLAVVFADLRRQFASVAAAKSLRLEFSETQVALSTDQMLLNQLLQNLLGNALKYTERGHVGVSQSFDADALVLTVEDSGIGIAADKLERIFDEYYQVDPRGAPRLGVGLGLAIVREVSRLLGYRVAVTSRLGEGTRISVRIPRNNLLADAPRPAPRPAADAAPPLPQGRLILLEDNQAVRVATELFLNMEGYRTQSAGSVAEVEALIGQIQPGDVLIADYRLDGQSTGLDVLHRLRTALGWEIPVVLLSGDLESVRRVVKSPIARCRFLSKPVDTKALTAAIAELAAQPPNAAPPTA